jgi:prepilin-type N-terminal cleavage/methylation domain-containing protein
MNRTQNIKGFTIIEVVLVLAIAGLIFLMVFIALPALQAGQRDTARKSDVSNVASAVNSYASANRGKMPAAGATSLDTQLGATGTGNAKTYSSLSNNVRSVIVNDSTSTAISAPVSDGVITIYIGMKCSPTATNTATNTPIVPGTARQYATVTKLEGGGGTGYCL